MTQPRRRVTYVIPPPTEHVPSLQLPPCGSSRLGATTPNIIPLSGNAAVPPVEHSHKRPSHPRHRLGVASLALDFTTQLVGREAPEGILYSGGRDGLIISWDLGFPAKRKRVHTELDDGEERPSHHRWEVMTGWADEDDDDFDEVEGGVQRGGDVLGDVVVISRRNRKRRALLTTEDSETSWELDASAYKPETPSYFRQSCQAHTDWVNDILLCNSNRTVVSASSDGTVKAWNPHTTLASEPTVIGAHSDYVRCIAHCQEQNWIASGSFDRTIKLWDLNRAATTGSEAVITLNPPDATAPKSSIYALTCDPYGHTIASGSPERVVRLWDPRSGKRTGKLVGHTDNIRAILISDDSRYLLTGSADATIKLWSLSSQRCLHTFTYHTESVWSLYSSHPSLEVFYSGDRSGILCKVDVENCGDISEGECILISQDVNDSALPSAEGINKIVALEDDMVWTATGTSSIKRWRVPSRRSARAVTLPVDVDGERTRPESPMRKGRTGTTPDSNTRPSTEHGPRASIAPSVHTIASLNRLLHREHESETTLYGIPFESLIKLTSPNDTFPTFGSGRFRDPEVATLYSAASIMSVPRNTALRSAGTQASFHPSMSVPGGLGRTEDTVQPTNTARAEYEVRELAGDAISLQALADYVIPGDHGLVRSIILNDRVHALTVDTAGGVAIWDIIHGTCRGRFKKEDIWAACSGSSSSSNAGGGAGGSGVSEKELSPRDLLEIVRERVEGDAVMSSWCSADTKTGVLAIHVNERCWEAEVYADEVGFAEDRHFSDESRINLGKWVLRNLFIGFIREELRLRKGQDGHGAHDAALQQGLSRVPKPGRNEHGERVLRSYSPETHRKPHRVSSSVVVSSPKMIPAIVPGAPASTDGIAEKPDPPATLDQVSSMAQKYKGNAADGIGPLITSPMTPPLIAPPMTATSSTLTREDSTSTRHRKPSLHTILPTFDDFGGWSGKSDGQPPTPSTPSAASAGGGLMGRLKTFGGKMAGRKASDVVPSSPVISSPATETIAEESSAGSVVTAVGTGSGVGAVVEPQLSAALQALLAGPLNPPPSSESPTYYLPSNTSLLISEESPNSSSYTTIYRGTVSTTGGDVRVLEEKMPMWLVEYLLINKIPQLGPVQKLSFVLVPWEGYGKGYGEGEEGEKLPELLNVSQSKLTASKTLRVKKIVLHVHERLEKMVNPHKDVQQDGGSISQSPPKPGSISGSTASAERPLQQQQLQSPQEDGQPVGQDKPEQQQQQPPPRPEEMYEILCNEMVLPLEMTLAAVRQYVWRQGGEVVMHYRRKRRSGSIGQ